MNFSRRVDWNKTWFLCFKTNTLLINLNENLQRYKKTVRGNWRLFFTSYKTMFLVLSNFDFQFLTMTSRCGQYFYRFSSACRLIEYNSSIRLTFKKLKFLRLRYETIWSNNFCQPVRSRTQKQVVGHENRGNKPYVRRTPDSNLILSFINPWDWTS